MNALWTKAKAILLCLAALWATCQSRSLRAAPPPTSQPEVYQAWPFTAKEAVKRQDDTAKALGAPKELTIEVSDKLNMKLLLIPAGKYIMGSSDKEQDAARTMAHQAGFNEFAPNVKGEGPQHEVTITKPFYMGVYDVTKGQFAAFVADTSFQTAAEKTGKSSMAIRFFPAKGGGWGARPGGSWKDPGFAQTDDHPVVVVNDEDAGAFCKWLGKKAGKTFKLPTEAQWEWACRAGITTAWLWGDTPQGGAGWCNAYDLTAKKQYSYFAPFPWDDGFAFTSPVGKFKPNAFGLYDMQGNVWQICSDKYDEKYYATSPKEDPPGSDSGAKGVMRGGSWYSNPWYCRIAERFDFGEPQHTSEMGFRVICTDLAVSDPATAKPR